MQDHWKLDRRSISELILLRGLKRYWIADVSGIHVTTLRRWLTGNIEHVTKEHAEKLASLLEVPVEEIIDKEENLWLTKG